MRSVVRWKHHFSMQHTHGLRQSPGEAGPSVFRIPLWDRGGLGLKPGNLTHPSAKLCTQMILLRGHAGVCSSKCSFRCISTPSRLPDIRIRHGSSHSRGGPGRGESTEGQYEKYKPQQRRDGRLRKHGETEKPREMGDPPPCPGQAVTFNGGDLTASPASSWLVEYYRCAGVEALKASLAFAARGEA
jgi:hypothetical protein